MGSASKYYSVFISQVGTADPTVKDIDNTIGRVIWNRTGVGVYTATRDRAFKIDKTVPKKDAYTDPLGNYMTLEHTDIDTMTLKTYAAVDTELLADSVLSNQYLSIEVYV